MTLKNSSYLVNMDPELWRDITLSIEDAYGQSLAGKLLNHMDMRDHSIFAQLWFLRESGEKLCSMVGHIEPKDNNFEDKFTISIPPERTFVISPNYDTADLTVVQGETLWLKCSLWGN